MKLIGKDTNKDAIVAYLTDSEASTSLTEKQQQLLKSYTDAFTLVRNYNSIPDAIEILIKLNAERGETISQSTARRYIYDALDVFGNVSAMKKDAIRHLSTEIIMDAIALARDLNDPKTMIQGAKELAILNGSDDTDSPNFDLLERHEVQINLDPAILQLFQELISRGALDLDTLINNTRNAIATDAIIVSDGN